VIPQKNASKEKTVTLVGTRVERGAAWLDQVAPGWEDKIDPHLLNISSVRDCVLGQLIQVDEQLNEQVLNHLLQRYPSHTRWTTSEDLHYEHVVAWANYEDREWDPVQYGFCPHSILSPTWETTDAWRKLILDRRKAKLPKRLDYVLAV
jgi:hypothetical protein